MKSNIKQLIEQAGKTGEHFTELRALASDVVAAQSTSDAVQIAKQLFLSEVHQARSLAVFMLGVLAGESKQCLNFLRSQVSKDEDWRVQEILAQAFDRFCSDAGYEEALPIIKDWLSDARQNVRRAVTEGLRIWTSRPYFKEHPEVAVQLLSNLHSDESEYVRKSVGNALRDISRKHKELIRTELKQWDRSTKEVAQTYKLASRFL